MVSQRPIAACVGVHELQPVSWHAVGAIASRLLADIDRKRPKKTA
jgi:hypothetical protein